MLSSNNCNGELFQRLLLLIFWLNFCIESKIVAPLTAPASPSPLFASHNAINSGRANYRLANQYTYPRPLHRSIPAVLTALSPSPYLSTFLPTNIRYEFLFQTHSARVSTNIVPGEISQFSIYSKKKFIVPAAQRHEL